MPASLGPSAISSYCNERCLREAPRRIIPLARADPIRKGLSVVSTGWIDPYWIAGSLRQILRIRSALGGSASERERDTTAGRFKARANRVDPWRFGDLKEKNRDGEALARRIATTSLGASETGRLGNYAPSLVSV